MIKDLLDIDKIELEAEASDWREALRRAGKVLVESGKIEKTYVENTIQAVEKLGPYIVIMPGVAFGHSRPDESVKESCIQLIRLKNPVAFGSAANDPVKLVFLFASNDDQGHMGALQDLAQMLIVPENVKILMESKEEKEIKDLLSSY